WLGGSGESGDGVGGDVAGEASAGGVGDGADVAGAWFEGGWDESVDAVAEANDAGVGIEGEHGFCGRGGIEGGGELVVTPGGAGFLGLDVETGGDDWCTGECGFEMGETFAGADEKGFAGVGGVGDEA